MLCLPIAGLNLSSPVACFNLSVQVYVLLCLSCCIALIIREDDSHRVCCGVAALTINSTQTNISCDIQGGGLVGGGGGGGYCLSPRQRRRLLHQSESEVSGEAGSRAEDAETLGVFDTLNLKNRPRNEKPNTAVRCRDSLLSHCPGCARLPASFCLCQCCFRHRHCGGQNGEISLDNNASALCS